VPGDLSRAPEPHNSGPPGEPATCGAELKLRSSAFGREVDLAHDVPIWIQSKGAPLIQPHDQDRGAAPNDLLLQAQALPLPPHPGADQ